MELSVKDVIEAMVKEDIYCGLIWNTEQNKYTGRFYNYYNKYLRNFYDKRFVETYCDYI